MMIICYYCPSGACTALDATGRCRKHSCGCFPLNRLMFHSMWCNSNSFTLLAFIMYRHMRSQAPLTRLIITTSCAELLSCTACLLYAWLRHLWKQEPRNLPFERRSHWGKEKHEYHRQHICKQRTWRPNWKPWFSLGTIRFVCLS